MSTATRLPAEAWTQYLCKDAYSFGLVSKYLSTREVHKKRRYLCFNLDPSERGPKNKSPGVCQSALLYDF